MKRALSSLLLALALSFGLTFARSARAQVSIQASPSASQVEVGQPFRVELTATSESQDQPSNPRLPVPPGVTVSSPSVGTRTQVTLGMGGMRQTVSTTASWELVASRVGKLQLGPPSVEAGGRRYAGNPIAVEVVPQGTLPPPRRRSNRFDPFGMWDPFGGGSPFPPGMFGQDEPLVPDALPPVPDEYKVEQAPDPLLFLRAVVNPKRAVVGEQVTLRIYVYSSRGPLRGVNPKEPTRPDFLSIDLDDPSSAEDWLRVPVGDTVFYAAKIYDYALFPVRSGTLPIGPMTLTVNDSRRSRAPLVRSSRPIDLEVEEPPLAGRPPGYRVGDVGELALEAEVSPEKLVAGDAVSVVAKLSGTGNIPNSLLIPAKRGIDWLDPTVQSAVEAKRGVVGGSRSFSYVVKLKEPGTVDLGELTLPYYDPKRRAYAVARAPLGSVEVTKNPQAVAKAVPSSGPVGAAAPEARKALGGYQRPSSPFTDDARFWWLLFGAPLAVALGGAGLELSQRLKRLRAAARSGPERLAQDALRAAEEAARGTQVAATAAQVERAIFLAIEGATGIRGRGLLRGELATALADAGLSEQTRARALELLDACESARFTGKSGDYPPRELLQKARGTVNEFARRRRRKS
jgi:hypothetical protein